jgi:hypothetical protein
MINRLIIILGLAIVFMLGSQFSAQAGGQYSGQYCTIKKQIINIKDNLGQVIDSVTKEIVTCDDGVKDFLYEGGIAKHCKETYFDQQIGTRIVTRSAIYCEKLDGTIELVDGYEIRQGAKKIIGNNHSGTPIKLSVKPGKKLEGVPVNEVEVTDIK